MNQIISLWLGLFLTAVATPVVAGNQDGVFDRPFLELVGYIESPKGYNSVTGYTKTRPPKPITQLTLEEVLAFQEKIMKSGAKATALGRYQIKRDTLEMLIRIDKLSLNSKFDRHAQDRMARTLMRRCGFYDPNEDLTELANCLAGTWAALPMASGNKKGKSRYQGVIGNHSRTSLPVYLAVLKYRFPNFAATNVKQNYAIPAYKAPTGKPGGTTITDAKYIFSE